MFRSLIALLVLYGARIFVPLFFESVDRDLFGCIMQAYCNDDFKVCSE